MGEESGLAAEGIYTMSFLSGAKAAGKVPSTPNRPAPSTSGKPAARQANKPQPGRFSALGAAKPRMPRLRDGRYQVKVIKHGAFDGRNHDFFNATVEILQAAPDAALKVGSECLVSYMVDKGDMRDMNGPKVVSFAMTALGYATYEDFNEAYPENTQAREDLMNRVDGCDIDETEIGPDPLVGMILMVEAWGNGKTAPDGSEYQDYAWVVNEE
jgi:hypothetical protein